MNRRAFLACASGAMLAGTPKLKLSIFSKHLQWAPYDDMSAFAAEAGFDGVDITVRPGGHVLPERVAEDLPRAIEAVRRNGLAVPMITAAIVDTASPHAESIVKTASALGIHYYRWGGLKYSDDKPIVVQLDAMKPRIKALAELNEHYKMTAMYHTHSGMEVGAPIWDIWEALRGLDPRWVGINYDVAHAVIEGGLGGWIRSFQLTGDYLHGVALKDFVWRRNSGGEWFPDWQPAGQGMVNFLEFFGLLAKAGFSGPVQVHFEYGGLGGANDGSAKLAISRSELMSKCQRDLTYFRRRMSEAGLG